MTLMLLVIIHIHLSCVSNIEVWSEIMCFLYVQVDSIRCGLLESGIVG